MGVNIRTQNFISINEQPALERTIELLVRNSPGKIKGRVMEGVGIGQRCVLLHLTGKLLEQAGRRWERDRVREMGLGNSR